MNSLIEFGNQLVIGKESTIGASTIQFQLGNTKSRWESIELHSVNRQQSLEDALEMSFKDSVNEITIWLQEREKQIDGLSIASHTQDVNLFIQVCA